MSKIKFGTDGWRAIIADDYTASLIGAGIRSEEVQIWTDIDGMHNNDPRIVKGTKPIAQLSFDEAA